MSMYSKSELRAMKWRRRGRIGLAVVVLVLIATGFLMSRLGSNELQSQVAAAKAEGIPTTVEGLYRNPPVPPGENAAPFYSEAVGRHERSVSGFTAASKPNDPAWRLATLKEYENQKVAIALLSQGALLPHCDFEVDQRPHSLLELEIGPMYGGDPVVSGIRNLTIVLIDEAEAESFTGKADSAISLLKLSIRVANHLSETKIGVGYLVAEAIRDRVMRGLADVLLENGRKPGVPEAVMRTAASVFPDPDLPGLFAGQGALEALEKAEARSSDFAAELADDYSPEESDRLLRRLKLEAMIPGMRDRWIAVYWAYARDVVKLAKTFNGDWPTLELKITARFAAAGRGGMSHDLFRFCPAESNAPIVDLCENWVRESAVLSEACAIYEAWNRTGRPPARLPPSTYKGAGGVVTRLTYKFDASGFQVLDNPPHQAGAVFETEEFLRSAHQKFSQPLDGLWLLPRPAKK